MAEAFRRVLWSVPLLGVLTIALFSLLSRLESVRDRFNEPLFYNAHPTSATTAARRAVRDLLDSKPGAAQRMVDLGGAALPEVLEDLPTRPIEERRRIADALWPVAERMGFSPEDAWVARAGRVVSQHDVPTADEKLVFWERFGQEHATDLTPLSVQRLVKRVSKRDAQLRKRELLSIDTFALPFLVDALGRVHDRDDVDRCRRLIRYIAHATGTQFSVDANADVREARREVTRVRWFWDDHGPKWTQYSPVEFIIARVVQTEYAKWLIRTIRELVRLDQGRLTDDFIAKMGVSATLLSSCLAGLYVLAPLVSSAIQVVLLSVGRYRFERFGLRLVLTLCLVSIAAWSLRRSPSSLKEMVVLATLTGAAFGTFILQRELSDRLDWRTHQVLQRRGPMERVIAVGRWIAPTVPTLLPMALVEATTFVICLESAAGYPGAGALAFRAMLAGDLNYLMAFCLGLGLLTVGLQLIADMVLGDFDSTRVGG